VYSHFIEILLNDLGKIFLLLIVCLRPCLTVTKNMADAGNLVAGVFTAVGVLAVTALVLYLIAKALQKYKPPGRPDFPSAEYMNKVGALCPAGWLYKGEITDENGHSFDLCQNRNNVPVCRDWVGKNDQGEPGCYSAPGRLTVFPKIKDWDDYLKGDIPDDYRCKWINRCGPGSEVQIPGQMGGQAASCRNAPPASWIGISERC
jgi:hypothetical protein